MGTPLAVSDGGGRDSSGELLALASKISAALSDAESHTRWAIKNVIEAGHALISVQEVIKAERTPGGMAAWLRQSGLGISHSTAKVYMQLARNVGEASALSADVSIRQLLRELAVNSSRELPPGQDSADDDDDDETASGGYYAPDHEELAINALLELKAVADSHLGISKVLGFGDGSPKRLARVLETAFENEASQVGRQLGRGLLDAAKLIEQRTAGP